MRCGGRSVVAAIAEARSRSHGTLLIAIGGGVVGDLAGFVAASFARGVLLVQVPTTLLAQVDSSVGGKVGINLPSAKNMVGAFWQPLAVLIDTDVLNTLPMRYRAGLAEVIKYGVILDAEFFAWLESCVAEINARDPAVLQRYCPLLRTQSRCSAQDEREETGVRAVLNYGHTFCHAFEAATGYGQLLHGEAVAIGMRCLTTGRANGPRGSRFRGSTSGAIYRFRAASRLAGRRRRKRLVGAMIHDKKTEAGKLCFDSCQHAWATSNSFPASVDPGHIRAALSGLIAKDPGPLPRGDDFRKLEFAQR